MSTKIKAKNIEDITQASNLGSSGMITTHVKFKIRILQDGGFKVEDIEKGAHAPPRDMND